MRLESTNFDPAYTGALSAAMFLPIMIVALVLLLLFAVVYFLFSYGLYKIAENEKVENSWFAFIPILQYYTLAKVAGEVKIGSYVVPRPELVLTLGWLLTMILTMIPFIGTLIGLAYSVAYYAVLYAIYKKYRGEKATVMLVISIITGGIGTIVYFFKIKDESPLNSETPTDTCVM